MKRIALFLLLAIGLAGISCEEKNQEPLEEYLVAVPLTMSEDEFRNSVDIVPPLPIDESGKIYTFEDLIFVNDKYRGIHVIDNSNPHAPLKQSFIKIPGNVDIAVKDNFLYADSIRDLLVFDISDINNIRLVNRLINVLRENIVWPFEADVIDYALLGDGSDVLIGWDLQTQLLTQEEFEQRFGFTDDILVLETANADSSVGQGGSLARFNIVNDYLYAVDSHSINVFEISDLEHPQDMEDVYAGFDIETLFHNGQYLFLGSMRGMYIYDISNPAVPEFVSEFQHGTACDPVVVDGDYAYVTLRGGSACGALESGLFIVDISDIRAPTLATSYPMDEPYGLGIKEEKLFICDGASGLKVYDKTDIEQLITLDHFEDIVTFDVIPMESYLLMVGEDVLYQYEYQDNSIDLVSRLELN
ncbi:MAG: LVIVD repeat-containing protein [Flavobacteriaceae bacterium]